jgi:hypothetical protein
LACAIRKAVPPQCTILQARIYKVSAPRPAAAAANVAELRFAVQQNRLT